MNFFKKNIAYSRTWKSTLTIGLIVGFIVSTIIIFLKPFDTSQFTASFKNFRLSGYGLLFLILILIGHPIENLWYKKQKYKWHAYNELVYVSVVVLIMLICSASYSYYLVNELTKITSKYYQEFFINFGLPFAPIILPIWIYLRFHFGNIEIPITSEVSNQLINVTGENKAEKFSLQYSNFVYAQSKQNYVVIYHLDNGTIRTKMFRNTLTKLKSQIPQAWQVHRSFLVNLDYLSAVKGNTRKRYMTLTINSETIPISQKYFEALKKRLSISSQKIQQ